jgi:hypothetical protein
MEAYVRYTVNFKKKTQGQNEKETGVEHGVTSFEIIGLLPKGNRRWSMGLHHSR